MLLHNSAPNRSVLFDIVADADAGLLPRVLVPFARRDLVPDHVRARRVGDRIEATLALEAMPAETVSWWRGTCARSSASAGSRSCSARRSASPHDRHIAACWTTV